VTGPFLPHAFPVLKAWGFRYSGLGFTWTKLKRSWQPGFLGFTESDLHVGLGRTGRRVERIVREGPIALVITTTGELHAENETRMLSFHVSAGHGPRRTCRARLWG
jgi:hypothetical protein